MSRSGSSGRQRSNLGDLPRIIDRPSADRKRLDEYLIKPGPSGNSIDAGRAKEKVPGRLGQIRRFWPSEATKRS